MEYQIINRCKALYEDNLHEDKDGCCELFSAPPNDVNEKKENSKSKPSSNCVRVRMNGPKHFCWAHYFPPVGDSIFSSQYMGPYVPTRHEIHQTIMEKFTMVFLVEFLSISTAQVGICNAFILD
uniref:Uncharacterized protein n=1 Tax=Magallana gigas TaxID=29159 RepID=K1QCW0_MAGGI